MRIIRMFDDPEEFTLLNTIRNLINQIRSVQRRILEINRELELSSLNDFYSDEMMDLELELEMLKYKRQSLHKRISNFKLQLYLLRLRKNEFLRDNVQWR